jgi:hypothetical protein
VTAAENKIVVADVTNPAVATTIGSTDYEHVAYAHQGWFDESQSYWFVNDELAQMTFPDEAPNTRTIVMDLTDLDDPKPSFDYHPPNPLSGDEGMKAITHNNYVVDGLLYQSNYSSGLRIADVSGVAEGQVTEVAWFDTYPTDDETNFDGTWSNYPFFSSGTIAVSGRHEGLFLLGLSDDGTTDGEPAVELSCTDCPVDIRSGETGTAALAVASTGGVDDSYDLAVSGLPEGWAATASPDPVSVSAGEVGIATLTITVPRQARQGTYTLTAIATSRSTPASATRRTSWSRSSRASRRSQGRRPTAGTRARMMTIDVPPRAQQGTYTFTVEATSGVDPSVSDTTAIVVEVSRVSRRSPGSRTTPGARVRTGRSGRPAPVPRRPCWRQRRAAPRRPGSHWAWPCSCWRQRERPPQ